MLGEHKYEHIDSNPLINCPLMLTDLLDLASLFHSGEQAVSLISIKTAKIHDFRSFYTSMLVDVVKNHLLLLDRRKPGLADIFRFLPDFSVQGGTEGVGSAPAGAVGFQKAAFHQFFQRCTDIGLRFLDGWGKIGGGQATLFAQAGQDDQ